MISIFFISPDEPDGIVKLADSLGITDHNTAKMYLHLSRPTTGPSTPQTSLLNVEFVYYDEKIKFLTQDVGSKLEAITTPTDQYSGVQMSHDWTYPKFKEIVTNKWTYLKKFYVYKKIKKSTKWVFAQI